MKHREKNMGTAQRYDRDERERARDMADRRGRQATKQKNQTKEAGT